jgi:hypothetical protein
MPWQVVTLITPQENITIGNKIINIHNIEIIKIDEHGGLNFIEKQNPTISKEDAEFVGFEKLEGISCPNAVGEQGKMGETGFSDEPVG